MERLEGITPMVPLYIMTIRKENAFKSSCTQGIFTVSISPIHHPCAQPGRMGISFNILSCFCFAFNQKKTAPLH